MNTKIEIPEGAALLEPRSDFDKAIIGTVEQFGKPESVVYNKRFVLEILGDQGMTDDEALEFFEFNVLGACIGEQMPVFLTYLSDV